MIQPIGIAKRVEYFLKNPKVKEFCLNEVSLSNKKLTRYPQRHILYNIDRNWNYIFRTKIKGLDNTRIDFWEYEVIDDKPEVFYSGTSILNKSGEIHYSKLNDSLRVIYPKAHFEAHTFLNKIENSKSSFAEDVKHYCKLIKNDLS